MAGLVCVTRYDVGATPAREFVWGPDIGALTRVEGLSASFGAFQMHSKAYLRSYLHAGSGAALALSERDQDATGDGVALLWAGALVACSIMAGHEDVRLAACPAAAAALAPLRCADNAAALLELGAGHGLPSAVAAEYGAAAWAGEHPSALPFTHASLQQLADGSRSVAALARGVALPWGEPAAAASAVQAAVAGRPRALVLLGCDVLYRADAVPTLVATLAAAAAAAQAAGVAPTVVLVSDPDCVPGATALVDSAAAALRAALPDWKWAEEAWGAAPEALLVTGAPLHGAVTSQMQLPVWSRAPCWRCGCGCGP